MRSSPVSRSRAHAVLDTETSGLFRKDQPDTGPDQPRLASLAIIKTTPTWSISAEHNFYIKPTGWKMQPEATEANGLTDEFLQANGRPVEEALDLFISCVREGRVIGAFNVAFDIRVIRAELARLDKPSLADETMTVCAMLKCIGVVRAMNVETGRLRTPKLAEALAHFKIRQMGAHTAAGDAIGALQVLKMLEEIGINLSPQSIKERVWKEPRAPKEQAKARPQRAAQASWLDKP